MREIVVEPRSGRWYTVGDNGAEFVNIPKDSIVFNHLQTEEILKNGFVNSRATAIARGTALADGNAFVGGHIDVSNIRKTGGSGYSATSDQVQTYAQQAQQAVSQMASNVEDDSKELIDHVETYLSRLQRVTELYLSKAELANNYAEKLINLQGAMENVERQIEASALAAAKYREQANAVGLNDYVKRQYGENAPDVEQLVRDGAIDISYYDEETRKLIDEYKKWYDLMLESEDAWLDLRKQQVDIEQKRLDAISEEYDSQKSYFKAMQDSSNALIDYWTAIGKPVDAQNAKNQLMSQIASQQAINDRIQTEMADYQRELAFAASIFGDASLEYQEAVNTYEEMIQAYYEGLKAVKDLNKQLKQLDISRIQYVLNSISDFGNRLAAALQLRIARKGPSSVTENDYWMQIKNNNDQIQQQWNLRRKYAAELADYEIGSEEYDRVRAQIEQIDQNIITLAQDNETLNDSIRALRWKPFNDLIHKLDYATEEYEFLFDLIKEESRIDDNGALTTNGLAAIGLIGENIKIGEQKIANYRKALEKLEDELASGNITHDEFNELSEEYLGIIRNTVKSIQDYRDELIGLYEDQITKENEALKENISLRKDALTKKQQYYSYDKKIKNQNKDIQSLKAQIQALQGVNNQATRAELARLQAQLADAQEALDETVRDHEVDIRISGYDQLTEDADKALEETLRLIELNADEQQKVVSNMLDKMKSGYQDAYGTIQDLIKDTGLVMSDTADSMLEKISQINSAVLNMPGASSSATGINTTTIGSDRNSDGGRVDGAVGVATDVSDYQKKLTNAWVKVSPASLTLSVGQSKQLTASGNTEINANWESTRPSVATVANGVVTGVAPGTATIRVRDVFSGKSASCTVTVKAASVKGYAKGSMRIKNGQWAWTQENGPELVVSRGNTGVLTQLNPGDGVIPADITKNLMEWGKLNPEMVNQYLHMPGVNEPGAYKNMNINNSPALSVRYDALIQINGNVDQSVVGQIQDIANALVSNRQFMDNLYADQTRRNVRELRKL